MYNLHTTLLSLDLLHFVHCCFLSLLPQLLRISDIRGTFPPLKKHFYWLSSKTNIYLRDPKLTQYPVLITYIWNNFSSRLSTVAVSPRGQLYSRFTKKMQQFKIHYTRLGTSINNKLHKAWIQYQVAHLELRKYLKLSLHLYNGSLNCCVFL